MNKVSLPAETLHFIFTRPFHTLRHAASEVIKSPMVMMWHGMGSCYGLVVHDQPACVDRLDRDDSSIIRHFYVHCCPNCRCSQ